MIIGAPFYLWCGLCLLSMVVVDEGAKGWWYQVGTLLSAAGMVDCVRDDKFFFLNGWRILDFVTCIHGGDR